MHLHTNSCDKSLFILCTWNDLCATHCHMDPPLCTWFAYKCSHTNHFAVQFPLPSCTIPTTVPVIPTTILNAGNPIKCWHCIEMCSSQLLFMVIESPKAQSPQWWALLQCSESKKNSYHFWLLHLDCHHLRQPMKQSEKATDLFWLQGSTAKLTIVVPAHNNGELYINTLRAKQSAAISYCSIGCLR